MTDALVRLHRVVDRLRAGDDDDRWLAERLAAAMAEPETRLDAHLGVPARWQQRQRLTLRNALIGELAVTFSGSTHARAVAVQQALEHYAGCVWPRVRHLAQPPSSADRRQRLCHQILSVPGKLPTGVRQLIDIVEVCNPATVEIANPPVVTDPDCFG